MAAPRHEPKVTSGQLQAGDDALRDGLAAKQVQLLVAPGPAVRRAALAVEGDRLSGKKEW